MDSRLTDRTPDAVSRRRAVISRFAKLNAIAEEKRRQEVVRSLPKDDTQWPDTPWTSISTKGKCNSDQLAYSLPYQAEYQASADENVSSKEQEQPNVLQEGSNSDCASERSIASAFIANRLQKLRKRGPLSQSTAMDFEKLSTILPSSETNQEEYASSLNIDELRNKYFKGNTINKNLPIYNYRSHLINSINSYSVVIVEGSTGCGKTTQVPVYILEDAILDKKQKNAPMIYVTQPRRIAARSIARRVCQEHNWNLGELVGYQVGLDRKISPQTILVYCTSGVLLQKLIQEKSLKNYTHIIIDEVHERDADTDLLLMMIRTLMRQEMSFFRLIVMSATMDMTKLKSYFTFKTNYGHRALTTPSLCKVGNDRRTTDLQIVYFDKLRSTFQINDPMPAFDLDQPEAHEECFEAAVKIIIDVIPRLDTYSESSKSTLVFLPGLAEINKLHKLLQPGKNLLEIVPLHSCLTVADQNKAFESAPKDHRKVILATNIAESSITVPDVGFIVDFCLTKTLKKDNITMFPTLKLQWSTDDKSIQRAGRTGRCCPGKVFRMVSLSFYKQFELYAEPELLTAPLELSVLRIKNFQMGEVKALLAVVLDPPPLNEIRTAVLQLKQIGALSSTYEGKLSDIDGDLTELGRVISALPIDVHLSKLIVMASILDVLEDAIIVAACLSTNKTVVKHLFGNFLQTYDNKLKWSNGSYSDLFVSLDVYKEYIEYKEDQGKSEDWLRKFCDNRYLDERKLNEVYCLIQELMTRLEGVNIRVFQQPNRKRNRSEDELMLKIAFCASFYPNYFLSQEMDAQEIKKELCGFDPTKTVVVHGMSLNEVPLYRTQILNQMAKISDQIDYIADCSKALLVFNDDTKMLEDTRIKEAIQVDGIIQPTEEFNKSLYMALKLSECKKIYIREYSPEVALERIQYYKERKQQIETGSRIMPPWMKLVVGRRADNSKLTEMSADDYNNFTKENFCLEIEFNEEQDKLDLGELYELEAKEEARTVDVRKGQLQLSHDDMPAHHLFKEGYKALRGPSSPIQMKFRSLLERSKGFNVDIEPLSVNSVLLNADFDKDRRQLLVAASVYQNRRSRILARDTTLMPNIRGLATLMSLMFAQYYRVIYNEQLNCLAGAIFGLGWDEDDKPVDRQYEVDLGFDIQISKDDIDLINQVRGKISYLIRQIDIQNAGAPRAEVQKELREIILVIIRKRRFPLKEIPISLIDWSEGEFIKDKHNVPKSYMVKLKESQTRIFLPIMESTRDFTEMDTFVAIRRNLDHMDSIQACLAPLPNLGVRCLLCGNGRDYNYLSYSRIVAHINSDAHIKNLVEFELYEEHCKRRQSRTMNNTTEF